MKRALIAVLMLAACAAGGSEHMRALEARPVAGFGPQGWEAIRVAASPTLLAPSEPSRESVGELRFRGGIVIASDNPRFGGLSGIYADQDGKVLAVTDQGDWFAAQLVLDEDGALTGVADGRIASMRDEAGRPLANKTEADAEDLARLPDGRFAVSFERIHRVRIYDLDGKGPGAPAEKDLALAGVAELTANDSLEAIATYGEDLLIGAEGMDKGRPPYWIAPLVSDALAAPAGRATLEQGYGLVALAALPGGDYLAMERFFAPLIGPRIILKRLKGPALAEGRWEAETIAELNPPVALDNFEGLAVVPMEGAVRLYIVSDDNFSRSQRTLLYAFDYTP
jgi:hypothetical protein